MKMNKENSITHLLKRLEIEQRNWAICDYWKADRCAVGVTSESEKDRLVYVSTFNKLNEKFDYECEQAIHGASDGTDYETVDEGYDVAYNDLVSAMIRHLGMAK